VKLRPLGIRARLTAVYVLLLAAAFTAFGAVSYRILKSRLDNDLSQELVNRGAALRGYFHFDNGDVELTYDADDPEQASFIQISTRYYQIYNARNGRLMAQSPELEVLGLELTPEEVRAVTDGQPFHDVGTDAGVIRFRNEILNPAPGEEYLFQVGISLNQMNDTLKAFLQLLLWLIPSGIAIISLVGWWAAGHALQPVATLASNVQQIGVSDLTKRLPIRGTRDELDRLTVAFNEMLSRLARTIEEMRQFTASISHELRTPLSILRGEAEVALMQAKTEHDYRRLISSQLEEFDRLTRMINQLLTLARAEAGEIPIEHKPVDLRRLAQSLADQMAPVAEARGVTLRTDCDQRGVIVSGDASWLQRVILNLVDNAIKFTPDGGTIIVGVQAGETGGVFEVQDTGSGIPAESVPRIFERFYQADPARSERGAGLGLSLVKWVVDQHGGTIEVTSQPGDGSRFRVVLPYIKTS